MKNAIEAIGGISRLADRSIVFLLPTSGGDIETDEDAVRLLGALNRFTARHPTFGAGVSPQEFRQLSWRDRQLYKRFMHRVVGFLGAIFDAAGPTYEAKWKRDIWAVLDRHPAAIQRWKSELGIDQLS